MEVHSNARGAQPVEHLTMRSADLIQLQTDDIQVQTGVAVRMLPRRRHRQFCQQRVISRRNFVAPRHKCLQPLHLAQAERGMQIGHAIVETQIKLLIVPRTVRFVGHLGSVACDAVISQQLHTPGELRIVGERHSPLGGRDDLDRVKAEHGDVAITAVADWFAAIPAADAMRGVLDDLEAITVAQCVNRHHLARLPAQMDRNHNLRQAALPAAAASFSSSRATLML